MSPSQIKSRPCVQCGYCCTVSPCFVGEWDAEKKQCKFLTANTKCAKYDDIIEREKDYIVPMMGCGCSSPLLNDRRSEKMRELGLDPEAEQKEINASFGLDFGEGFEKLWNEMQKNKE